MAAWHSNVIVAFDPTLVNQKQVLFPNGFDPLDSSSENYEYRFGFIDPLSHSGRITIHCSHERWDGTILLNETAGTGTSRAKDSSNHSLELIIE